MGRYISLILILLFLIYLIAEFSGCTTAAKSQDAPETAVVTTAPANGSIPANEDSTVDLAHAQVVKLSWGHDDWTKKAEEVIKEELPSLSHAHDITTFCPNFDHLKPEDRIQVLGELVSSVTKYESGFNPKSKMQEAPPPKGPGTLSAGLLQISIQDHAYGGHCAGLTLSNIFDPIINLECGIHIMGVLASEDHVIQSSNNKGLSRYWSVLRDGHHVKDIKKAVSSLAMCK